jgi:4-amino-4-deoxychorismate lyase
VSEHCAIWLDGTPISELPLPNRGLDFGDGVFETLLVYQGKPLYPELHLERLALGLNALTLPDCLSAARMQLEQVAAATGDEGYTWAALRLSVNRGAGPRGYAPATAAPPVVLITVYPLDRDCAKLTASAELCVADIRLSAQPLLAGVKHLNRLEQVLAAGQAQAQGVEECVVLDQAEQVTSVVAGNLFIVKDGELLTPRLLHCGIPGTRRRLIIEKWAPSIGLKVREVKMSLSDVNDADEVFYSNSLVTVRPVAKLASQAWDTQTVCEAIFQQYSSELT